MNKKLILLVLKILIAIAVVVAGGFAVYYWSQGMPMKAVLCGMGGAMIIFNFIVAIFLVKRNIKK